MLSFICSTNQRESQAMTAPMQPPLRIIFAGTPDFACASLDALLASAHTVLAVLTQADQPLGRGLKSTPSPVKQLATAHRVPVLTPASLKSKAVQAELANYAPDLLVVVAYGKLLPLPILNLPTYGCLNVHASLLPRWRGASPIQQAILSGDAESGVSLMQMSEGLDEGPVLAQTKLTLSNTETAQSLHDKLAVSGADLLIKTLATLPTRLQEAAPQPAKGITYAPKINKTDGSIRWHATAEHIDQQIRAFTPWPTAYTTVNQTLVKIHAARLFTQSSSEPAGTIIDHTTHGIVVQTGKGCLEILSAQLPGKKRMAMPDVLRGHHALFQIGAVLGK